MARAGAQMIGMVMAVHAVQHLDAHAEKPRGFPLIDPRLHEPCGARVPQRVGADVAVDLRELRGGLEGGLYRTHRLAVPFDEVSYDRALFLPAAKMREQARRDRNGCLALVGLASALGKAIENAALPWA